MILFFFAVGLSFGQRSNAKESEKFYTKNWKVVKIFGNLKNYRDNLKFTHQNTA